jgi:hypothetical protein
LVTRVETKGLDEFTGTVESVELEVGIEDRKQYHIVIDPEDIEVKGATGRMHEWIPMSPKAKEDALPQGCVMDRYLLQLEIVVKDAKKKATVREALQLMIGKKFKFSKIKLGKDFSGHPAKEYIVPVQLIA